MSFLVRKKGRVSSNIHGIKERVDLELVTNLGLGLNDLLKSLEDVSVV